MFSSSDISKAVKIKLDGELPEMPKFVEDIRRAPSQGSI